MLRLGLGIRYYGLGLVSLGISVFGLFESNVVANSLGLRCIDRQGLGLGLGFELGFRLGLHGIRVKPAHRSPRHSAADSEHLLAAPTLVESRQFKGVKTTGVETTGVKRVTGLRVVSGLFITSIAP